MRQQHLFEVFSNAIQARQNCAEKMDGLNPNAVTADVPMSENQWHQTKEWFDTWTERAKQLCKDFMPHGSGIDNGVQIDLDHSHADKLVFHTAYHHMNDAGYYDGWTEHTVTVTPSLSNRYNIRIGGRNRNDIKDYLHEEFDYSLCKMIEWSETEEKYVACVVECYVPAY